MYGSVKYHETKKLYVLEGGTKELRVKALIEIHYNEILDLVLHFIIHALNGN